MKGVGNLRVDIAVRVRVPSVYIESYWRQRTSKESVMDEG
jgi:hypothetical protein